MKNPNGYGGVVRLGKDGTRRNNFAVRKTVGFNEKGHPIYETIGYYPTREAGMIALAEYNKNPWNIDQGNFKFEDLYELWLKKKSPKLGESNLRGLKTAYTHCVHLQSKKYSDIKAAHMQDAIDNCGHGYSTQATIKNLFYHLDRFALELDLNVKRFSELLTTAKVPESTKKPFSKNEIDLLWKNIDTPYADIALLFLYTGFRISELLNLKSSDVDMEQRTMTGGIKTEAGKNRVVPIHSAIYPITEKYMKEGNKYFISFLNNKYAKTTFYRHWDILMGKLNMLHGVHECRHTFRSRLDSAGANKTAIDLLMGHKSQGTGERIYTHKTLEELRKTIELLD